MILFKNVTNADDVHRALLDRSLQPEMALVDPAPTHSLFALHAAAHKAVVDDARGVLTTRTVHSELVYNLSANKHITEGLRRFGMAGDASAVLACRFDATDADVLAMANVIAGDAVPAYYVLAPAEASTNLSRYDGVRFGHRCENPVDLDDLYRRSRGEGFGPEVKRRILTGTYALSVGYYDAYYRQAQRVRRRILESFTEAFESVDALFLPTTPTTAFKLGEKRNDPIALYEEDRFTIPANLAGLPALSLPVGFSNGLPVGGQLLAPHFEEGRILSLAHAFQQVTDHHRQRPTAGGAA